MSKIDGIKNSIGHIKRYAETVHAESYLDDVQYLLAKLEQAERDIETAYDYIKQTDREINKRQLLDALKKLRED